jgi:phosphatidylserine/phosphatidylglycerophosphate/cardiolipin synthase-like enzyme
LFAGQSSRDLRLLATALREGRLSEPVSDIAVSRLGVPAAKTVANDLAALAALSCSAKQLVVCFIEALAGEREIVERGRGRVELVATGPDLQERSRNTAVVVEQLFCEAAKSVLIVGFALYGGLELFRTIATRMDAESDLAVTCCFDVSRKNLDTTRDTDLVDRFADRFTRLEWPGTRLPAVYYDPRGLMTDGKKRAVLHAKAVAIDGRKALVTSANPTRAAYLRNIELGVLIDDVTVASGIEQHFLTLIGDGFLKPINF